MTASQAPLATTFDLDDRHFSFWRDQFCDQMLGADPPTRPPTRLRARLGIGMVGDGGVSLDAHVLSPGLSVGRSARRIAHESRSEAIGLTVVLQGSARVELPGGDVVLQAGDVGLLQSDDVFIKRLDGGYREFFLYLPRPYLRSLIGVSPERRGPVVAPPTGLARILAGAMASAAASQSQLAPGDWAPVVRSVVSLAAAVFGGDEAAREQARPAARAAQRERVVRHIEERLADPALTPATIAAELGMSIRYLHLLFEGTGETAGATILARRLDRCREALADPGQRHRNVSEIAFAWGFNDAAHFSRAFKARFGVSPRDARADENR